MAAAGSSTTVPLFVTAVWGITALLLSTTTEAEEPYNTACFPEAGNYTAGSPYRANLDVVLGSLASTTNTTAAAGFSTNITGEAPDRVFGLALCRGDATPAECGAFVQIATADISQICGFRRNSMLWYDKCYLRYSDGRFLGSVDTRFRVYFRGSNNIGSGAASRFNSSVWAALQGLAQYAADNASARPPLFAAGEMALGADVGFPTLYGLVQCTRDLSADDCRGCLRGLITNDLPNFAGKISANVIAPSCNIRYEIWPFYNPSAALTLPPLPTTPSPPLPPSPRPSVPVPGTNDTGNSTIPSDGSSDGTSPSSSML